MIRTRVNKNERKQVEHVLDRAPLAHSTPNNHPMYVADVRAGAFERAELIVGRGLFRNEFSRQVYYLARLGARLNDIAEFFGVEKYTVETWAVKNDDFKAAMCEGQMMFGMKVAETLGQRALGYDYVETEVAEHIDKHGNIHQLTKTMHKHMAPDVTAIIFYLKNRHRGQWADVNRVEIDTQVSIDVTQQLDMTQLTEDEQAMIRSIAIKKIANTHGVTNE